MLHAVMVVSDIQKQQAFYTDILGMSTLRYRSLDDGSANGFSGNSLRSLARP
jgi:catechol 2,3-dioxygenase-like lactoylglutathione lyase family enzyme